MENEEKSTKAVILGMKTLINYGKPVEKKVVDKIESEILRAGLRGIPLN